jgi:hypothetical protein
MRKKTTPQLKGKLGDGVFSSQIPPLPIRQEICFLCRPYGLPLLGQEALGF